MKNCKNLIVLTGEKNQEWNNILPLFALGLKAKFHQIKLKNFLELENKKFDKFDFVFFLSTKNEMLSGLQFKTDLLDSFQAVFADMRFIKLLMPNLSVQGELFKTKVNVGRCIRAQVPLSNYLAKLEIPNNYYQLNEIKTESGNFSNIIKHNNNNLYFFQPPNFSRFLYQDCRFIEYAKQVFDIFKKFDLYKKNYSPWNGKKFAIHIRDDDVHPYLTKNEIKNHKEIIKSLTDANIKVSLALITLGSQFIKDYNEIMPNSYIKNFLVKILSPLREIVGTLKAKYVFLDKIIDTLITNKETSSKNADFVNIKNFKGKFHGYDLILTQFKKTLLLKVNGQEYTFGDSFALDIKGRKFKFHYDSVDDLENPSKLFLGFLGSIKNQYNNNYIKYLKKLSEQNQISVSIHGITHHQHRLTKGGADQYGEFYEPGSNKQLPVESIVNSINKGIEEIEDVFGNIDKIFTAAYGHPTKNTLQALTDLNLPYYPYVESTLASPIKVQGNYILGISHIYFRRFTLVKKFLKYTALNHGVANFAIHGILGDEPTYSSHEFADKIQKYLKNQNYLSVFPTEAIDVFKNKVRKKIVKKL